MPAAKLSLRIIREILRMKLGLGRSHREIGLACRISSSTVADTLYRFRASGLEWPLPATMGDEALEARLYRREQCPATSRPLPDWAKIYTELRKKHVTLALLWQEYRGENPVDGYEYSRFCSLYLEWKRLSEPPVMRQVHKFGEKVFVDFAGDTIPLFCKVTGSVEQIQLFVAVLGGSNYTYIEATKGQDLASWIGAHVRMLEFFGGCPQVVVPDNLKSGVTKADFYDPDLNPTYQAFADHYGLAILPARKRKPRDKAKVEQGVLLAERWVIAVLRNRTFYEFDELQAAIRYLNDRLNEKKFRKLPGCRRSLFEQQEQPMLQPLRGERFVLVFRKNAKVYLDYHVEFQGQFFSVPYHLTRKTVEIRYTACLIEIFHQSDKVATHQRRDGQRYFTNPDHMPPNHRSIAEWSPERFLAWGQRTGCSTGEMVARLLETRAHPEQSFRGCLGLLQGLPRQFTPERVEMACKRALAMGAHSYRSVKSILDRGLDQVEIAPPQLTSAGLHENIRGADYYAEQSGGEA